MKMTVVSRSGRPVIKGVIELQDSATVSDLQDAIHARRVNASFIESRPMPCTIGAFTTSSISWRRSLSTDSAMLLHLSPMYSGTAPLIVLLARILHTMPIIPSMHLLVICK
uniref:Uncharacterized protein LOC105045679 isoform X1 n=1 Tax=Elaeis guineensis var. tenera TaxID=51953 RepID=A0A8N4I8P8_ELAGV|nr:uncharacterized protein LOC105045679 isoform X1 [Elaeis guineensis]